MRFSTRLLFASLSIVILLTLFGCAPMPLPIISPDVETMYSMDSETFRKSVEIADAMLKQNSAVVRVFTNSSAKDFLLAIKITEDNFIYIINYNSPRLVVSTTQQIDPSTFDEMIQAAGWKELAKENWPQWITSALSGASSVVQLIQQFAATAEMMPFFIIVTPDENGCFYPVSLCKIDS